MLGNRDDVEDAKSCSSFDSVNTIPPHLVYQIILPIRDSRTRSVEQNSDELIRTPG